MIVYLVILELKVTSFHPGIVDIILQIYQQHIKVNLSINYKYPLIADSQLDVQAIFVQDAKIIINLKANCLKWSLNLKPSTGTLKNLPVTDIGAQSSNSTPFCLQISHHLFILISLALDLKIRKMILFIDKNLITNGSTSSPRQFKTSRSLWLWRTIRCLSGLNVCKVILQVIKISFVYIYIYIQNTQAFQDL